MRGKTVSKSRADGQPVGGSFLKMAKQNVVFSMSAHSFASRRFGQVRYGIAAKKRGLWRGRLGAGARVEIAGAWAPTGHAHAAVLPASWRRARTGRCAGIPGAGAAGSGGIQRLAALYCDDPGEAAAVSRGPASALRCASWRFLQMVCLERLQQASACAELSLAT